MRYRGVQLKGGRDAQKRPKEVKHQVVGDGNRVTKDWRRGIIRSKDRDVIFAWIASWPKRHRECKRVQRGGSGNGSIGIDRYTKYRIPDGDRVNAGNCTRAAVEGKRDLKRVAWETEFKTEDAETRQPGMSEMNRFSFNRWNGQ